MKRAWHPPPKYLHGSSNNPSTLFLPLAMIAESYRDEPEQAEIRKWVGFGWQAIAAEPRLCLYGLSLPALDAALGQIVSAGLSQHLGPDRGVAVHIFDGAEQVRKIEARLRVLALPDVNMTVTLIPVC